MPKIGMEPIRRRALVDAAIAEIGRTGTLDVTVSQIARKAGMSSALAHHYFGSKDQMFLSAMRAVLNSFGTEVCSSLRGLAGHKERILAVIGACFSEQNFRPEVVAAWLNFYVLAQTSPEARRLLTVYYRRLNSNLVHDLRPLIGTRAPGTARAIAALIDGLYIRQALREENLTGAASVALVSSYVESALSQEARP
ncbi:MAG: transcriptional regulator BetI [Rhodobacteraceae bacterium]|nr:transcriptional regulator BetI [Paracoccaceae bacterium]